MALAVKCVICSLQMKCNFAAFHFTYWAELLTELHITVEDSTGGIRSVPVCVARGMSSQCWWWSQWGLLPKASQAPEHHRLAIRWEIPTNQRRLSNRLIQSHVQGLLAGSVHGSGPHVAVLELVLLLLSRPSPPAATVGSKSLPLTLNGIPLLHFASALAEICSRSVVCGS